MKIDEIRFRGLCRYEDYSREKKEYIEKKRWVYGSLLLGGGGKFPETAQIWDKDGHNYNVIPETVGQFIGRQDKNGVDLFFGDKVKYYDHEQRRNRTGIINSERGVIYFGNYNASFIDNINKSYSDCEKITTKFDNQN